MRVQQEAVMAIKRIPTLFLCSLADCYRDVSDIGAYARDVRWEKNKKNIHDDRIGSKANDIGLTRFI